jgi:hypothetical protein
MIKPNARTTGLLTEQIGDELVIYDQEKKRAHRLNRTSAAVWRKCDGTKTVEDIAKLLQEELNPAADESLVLLTLSQLDTAHLLQESIQLSTQQSRTSRRDFVRKVGAVGIVSILLPLVTTMALPTPAQAQTCTGCGDCIIGCGICVTACGSCILECGACTSECGSCASECGACVAVLILTCGTCN